MTRQGRGMNGRGISGELKRREEQALEALVALALRHDQDGITDAEISRYMSKPVNLSKADAAALKRARPGLLKALREALKPDLKRFMAAWGKPANVKLTDRREENP